MRVYELARELGIESKELLARATDLDIAVKTASSGLDEEAVQLLKLAYTDDETSEPVVETPAPAAPSETAPAEPASSAEQPEVVAPAPEVAQPEPAPEPEAQPEPEPVEEQGDEILVVQEGITVGDFATLVAQRPAELVKQLLAMGEMVPVGGAVPAHALEGLGAHFGFQVLVEEAPEEEEAGPEPSTVEFEDDPASLKPRPPVVTVMGHVDHGKTQLLDTIRKANVVAGEAGGITQHIGAYRVEQNGSTITFIDTPGHEAFTSLRARGANVTDIVILVVAADDGVMPQTVEAINHTLAAGVPMIVAINKMDLETADPYAVRAALTQYDIVVEELGGDVVDAEVSALTGDGVDHLLELISIVAEVEELTANPAAAAVGTVIESELDTGRGPLGTVVVQRGTLERGDAIVAGAVAGRVRAMFDENGNQIKKAGPSTPVLIMGWDDVPVAGDMFQAVENEKVARSIAQDRLTELRSAELVVPTATERLGQLLESLRTADHAELRVIVKTDAHGSLEAIRDAVAKISRDDGAIKMIHGAVGGINARDIMLAEASEAIVYGFNVRPDSGARKAAKEQAIDIRTFSIIYELLDDVEALLVGQLTPESVETLLGVAEVRATFRAPRYGTIAGCYVSEGTINRNARARLVRDGVVIYNGTIGSLRRFKDDVASVATGFECGIGLENFRDIKEGDTIESYEVQEVARS